MNLLERWGGKEFLTEGAELRHRGYGENLENFSVCSVRQRFGDSTG